MLQLEVLVGELFAIDGAPTSSLGNMSTLQPHHDKILVWGSYVATGEVTTLKHELRDDSVELGASVALALLSGLAELLEVLRGFGDDSVEELEIDAAGLL